MSYLSDFEELNGGYVSFGGNPKGGKISSKGKIRIGSGPTWLFDNDSLTKTMNYQPVNAGNQPNPSADATFNKKKPDSEVIVSPRSSAQSRKQDDKNKREAKGKSHVESFTGYRDLNVEFEDYITYSNDEYDVGADADFNNLETSITSAFLYGTIKEEVYVCQPPGFKDPDHPDKVYKVVKAFYGLHQAPRAWYETLANYLLENGFQIGKIDQTLFIKRQKGDILLVQIYDKYVAEILRKFGLIEGKSASTPIDTKKPLLKDLDGEDVDVHTY
nr:putative ribonuclease H-like domain-containing protein [Tanacetum cinerariifolium]